jgi:DNA modification methylase
MAKINGDMSINKIINSDCIEGMKLLSDSCVDCCVTSPPYFGLRDYGHEGQIGLEETPEMFVDKMVEVFEQVRRVLKPTGTLWLNLGDSYAANRGYQVPSSIGANNGVANMGSGRGMKAADFNLKVKDLMGIPWMVAFALRSAGWYLRQDIIWHKPNPMPESVTDRCTKAHEYIFLLSKSSKYYYDHEAIKLPLAKASHQRLSQDVAKQKGSNRVPGKTNGNMKAVGNPIKKTYQDKDGMYVGEVNPELMKQMHLMTLGESIEYFQKTVKGPTFGGKKGREYIPEPDDPNFRNGSEQWGREWLPSEDGCANKRSVWTVTTKPFSEAHFATFPEDLIVDCIKAGCHEGGTVLDPFMGAGTTAMVARKLNRNYIGFELNKEYITIAEARLRNELGMFL